MRLGVIIDEVTRAHPLAERVRAIDAWIARAGATPAIVPTWAPGAPWDVDRHWLDELDVRGIQPVIYAESKRAPYRDVLAGKHDRDLRLLGARARGRRVRWDQEADGSGLGSKWQQPAERELYAEAFAYVAAILHDEGDCGLIWSPVDPSRAVAMGLYPGPESVDVIGFTSFNRAPQHRAPSIRWRRQTAEARAIQPGAPVWATETGILEGLPHRAAWLRAVPDADADVAIPFDSEARHPSGTVDIWRWSPSMYRAAPEVYVGG